MQTTSIPHTVCDEKRNICSSFSAKVLKGEREAIYVTMRTQTITNVDLAFQKTYSSSCLNNYNTLDSGGWRFFTILISDDENVLGKRWQRHKDFYESKLKVVRYVKLLPYLLAFVSKLHCLNLCLCFHSDVSFCSLLRSSAVKSFAHPAEISV